MSQNLPRQLLPLLLDAQGNVLEQKSRSRASYASITKVMTAIVALDSGVNLDVSPARSPAQILKKDRR